MDAGLILLLLVLGAAAFVWFVRQANESRIEAPPEVGAAGDDPAAIADLAEAGHLAAEPSQASRRSAPTAS